MLRGKFNTQVDMVKHRIPIEYPTFLLTGQFMKDRARFLSDLSEDSLSAPLGDEDYLVLGVAPELGVYNTLEVPMHCKLNELNQCLLDCGGHSGSLLTC